MVAECLGEAGLHGCWGFRHIVRNFVYNYFLF